MKAVFKLLLVSGLFLFLSTISYADCSGSSDGSCPDGNCSSCQCTDHDCVTNANDCLSKSRCCEAFGNVGGM